MDNHNPGRDYGPSNFDVDHRFVTSYVYNLPFGRGKHFLGNTSKALDMAIGGWELTGVTTFKADCRTPLTPGTLEGILDTQNQPGESSPWCADHRASPDNQHVVQYCGVHPTAYCRLRKHGPRHPA